MNKWYEMFVSLFAGLIAFLIVGSCSLASFGFFIVALQWVLRLLGVM